MIEADTIKTLYEKLIATEKFFFAVTGKVDVSEKQGVYIIYDQNNLVLHIGKTNRGKKGLDQRLQNHLNNQSSFSLKYIKKKNINLRNGCKFQFLEIENGRTRALVEALTTGMTCPAHIGTGEKKE